jgi:hypothetical protein
MTSLGFCFSSHMTNLPRRRRGKHEILNPINARFPARRLANPAPTLSAIAMSCRRTRSILSREALTGLIESGIGVHRRQKHPHESSRIATNDSADASAPLLSDDQIVLINRTCSVRTNCCLLYNGC